MSNQNLKKYRNVMPVPVVEVANAFGIEVYETTDLCDYQSGVILKEDSKYTIYVNKKHAPTRKRFTIAHELGHFIKHKNILDNSESSRFIQHSKQPIGKLERNSHKKLTDQEKIMEREANKFAAELLMPEKIFKKIWMKSTSIEEVAEYFMVSEATANIRGQELFGEYYF